MQFDWDVARAIMLKLEESETASAWLSFEDVPGFTNSQEVAYTMHILAEGGFIHAMIEFSNTGDNRISFAWAKQLTYKGHEFLNSVKHDNIWNQVKTEFKNKLVGATADIVLDFVKNRGLVLLGLVS